MKRPLIKGGQGRDGETLLHEVFCVGVLIAVCGALMILIAVLS